MVNGDLRYEFLPRRTYYGGIVIFDELVENVINSFVHYSLSDKTCAWAERFQVLGGTETVRMKNDNRGMYAKRGCG
jgi:hypothetical protein